MTRPVAENADAVRRQESAGRGTDRAPTRNQAAAPVETVDAAMAIAIGDVEAAIRREGDVAGMIEGMAGAMTLADLLPHLSLGVAEQDAMRVPVDDGDHSVRPGRDLVGIEAQRLAPAANECAIRRQGNDTRPGRVDRAVAAQQDMDEPIPIDGKVGDAPRRRRQRAPGALYAEQLVAKLHTQFRFHPDLVVIWRAAGRHSVGAAAACGERP